VNGLLGAKGRDIKKTIKRRRRMKEIGGGGVKNIKKEADLISSFKSSVDHEDKDKIAPAFVYGRNVCMPLFNPACGCSWPRSV
jgi:hypothetical protein